MIARTLIAALLALTGAPPALAAAVGDVPRAADLDYPGVIDMALDVTDVTRHVYRTVETIPTPGPGPMTLSLPKWIPGEHSPSGQIALMAGFKVTADGRPLAWRRDPVEMTAFHIEVPAGVKAITVSLEQQSAQPGGPVRIAVTPHLLVVKWTAMTLYPAGYRVSRIPIRARVKIPPGWTLATALDREGAGGAAAADGVTRFAATDVETLMDSPVYVGEHERSFDLDANPASPVRLHVFADHAEDLAASPEIIDKHRELIRQTDRLFGPSRRFAHYDFLLSLNEQIGYLGAEHLSSSENGYYGPGYFTDWAGLFSGHDILAHEYVHSWNGKHKRPADLTTQDYTEPMGDSLLWVYEGLTEYWGDTLATRAGLYTGQQMRDRLALIAANAQATPGRAWRALADTTNAYIMNSAGDLGAASWVRGLDYYEEGQLVWLDVDTLIRAQSQGRKSLDDFARVFFGRPEPKGVSTYTEDDVVAALNQVLAYDWKGFLHARLDAVGGAAPLDGLARGGWALSFDDQPSDYYTAYEAAQGLTILTYSVGLQLSADGVVKETLWNGPGFQAGVISGDQILAVDGAPYAPDRFKTAIRAAARPGAPAIALVVKADGQIRDLSLDYHGGLRYPHLTRQAGTPDRLDQILAPRAEP